MRNEEVREYLNEVCEDSIIFDNPEYDNSIVGVTTDGAVVYDYDSMAAEFAVENKCSIEEAMEFIDYNTIRAIPYMQSTGSVLPVIIDSMTMEILASLKDPSATMYEEPEETSDEETAEAEE